MDQLDDKTLIARARAGDETALAALIERYLPLVFGLARRYAGDPDKAADIAQEAFVKMWRNLGSFNPAKPFRPWLFVIAKHAAFDWLRRKEETAFSELPTDAAGNDPLSKLPDHLLSPAAALEQKLSAERVATALGKLPAHYRTVVSLRTKEELTFKEIAARMREPLNTVKSRYRRALRLLKIALAEPS